VYGQAVTPYEYIDELVEKKEDVEWLAWGINGKSTWWALTL
jgi:hypothetical protein